MSTYVEEVLVPNETITYNSNISLWAYAGWLTVGVLTSVLGIGLVILLIVYIKYKFTEIAITNKRLITKVGVIQRKTMEMNLSKIESLQVNQSIIGRIFNFGDVVISGTGSHLAILRHIKNPIEFRNAFVTVQDNS